jgi:hypothetical protein
MATLTKVTETKRKNRDLGKLRRRRAVQRAVTRKVGNPIAKLEALLESK